MRQYRDQPTIKVDAICSNLVKVEASCHHVETQRILERAKQYVARVFTNMQPFQCGYEARKLFLFFLGWLLSVRNGA